MAGGKAGQFAVMLRRYRHAAGLTQEELAARAGLSVRAVGNLERGDRRLPYPDTVHRLAEALRLTPGQREQFSAAARAHRTGNPPDAMATPLVNRTAEIEAIDRCLAGSGPPALFFAGEPGIGKTRLLRHAAEHGQREGFTVLEGGCRRDTAEPYAPFPEVLLRSANATPPSGRRRIVQESPWLLALLPELATEEHGPPSTAGLPPEQVRRLIFAAVGRYLERIAASAGVLLVLDDLQWAGADALSLLVTLIRTIHVPIRVVAAYRDSEPASRLTLLTLESDLAHAGLGQHMQLVGLSMRDAAALLAGLLAREVPSGHDGRLTTWKEAALHRAEGVPFYLVTCVEDLRLHGITAAPGIPWSVKQSLSHRLLNLPAEARDALALAAVIGSTVPRAIVLTASAQPQECVLRGLDAACAARMLQEEHSGTYSFVHDVIREAVEAEMGPARRLVLHQQVAEALERLSYGKRQPAEVALHWREAEQPQRALPYLLAAADAAAAVYAYAEAEHQYRTAVDAARSVGDTATTASALERLAGTVSAAGRFDEALTMLDEAVRLWRTVGDLDGEARATAQLGMVHRERGTPEEGIALLRALIDRTESCQPTSSLASLHTALSHALFVAGRYEESAHAAEQAAGMARTLTDGRLLAEADARLGACLTNLSQNDAAVPVLEEAVALAEQAGELRVLAMALTNLAFAYGVNGETERYVGWLERATDVIERLGDRGWLVLALANLGQAHYRVGRWSEARELCTRAVDMGRTLNAWTNAYPLVYLAEICAACGEYEEARALTDEALSTATRSGDRMVLAGIHAVLAGLDLDAGRPQAARDRLTQFLDTLDTDETNVLQVLPLLAHATLATGEVPAAFEIADEAVQRAVQLPGYLARALRARGSALLHLQRWVEARSDFELGLQMSRRLHNPYDEAQLLADLGRLHIRCGDREQARERLDQALSTLRCLGARPAIDQTELVLAALEQ